MTDAMIWAFFAFLAGGYFGMWSESRVWREKARSGFRIVRGGKLYVVHEDGETLP